MQDSSMLVLGATPPSWFGHSYSNQGCPSKQDMRCVLHAFRAAPRLQVIGNVSLGQQVSIWYGAILRGERSFRGRAVPA